MAAALRWQQEWNGSILSWVETWTTLASGSAQASISATASASFAGTCYVAGAFSIAPQATFQGANTSSSSGAFNVSASSSVLFGGFDRLQRVSFSVQGQASVGFLTDLGSSFYITDSQTEMTPSAMSINSASAIIGSAALAVWNGNQAGAAQQFSIAATSSLSFDARPSGTIDLSIPATLSVAFGTQSINGAQIEILGAVTDTYTGESTASGSFSIQAAARLRPKLVDKTTQPNPSKEDDEVGVARALWTGAAEVEKEKRLREAQARDLDDLVTLTVALATAVKTHLEGRMPRH